MGLNDKIYLMTVQVGVDTWVVLCHRTAQTFILLFPTFFFCSHGTKLSSFMYTSMSHRLRCLNACFREWLGEHWTVSYVWGSTSERRREPLSLWCRTALFTTSNRILWFRARTAAKWSRRQIIYQRLLFILNIWTFSLPSVTTNCATVTGVVPEGVC